MLGGAVVHAQATSDGRVHVQMRADMLTALVLASALICGCGGGGGTAGK